VRGRAVVVKRLKPLPTKRWCAATSSVPLEGLPADRSHLRIALAGRLKMAAKLPAPIFTPATKAEVGDHDENVSLRGWLRQLRTRATGRSPPGHRQDRRPLCAEARDLPFACIRKRRTTPRPAASSFADYQVRIRHRCRRHAAPDREALTPDSSRFWPADQYQEGSNPPSYDKQYSATT
jgi:phosphoribosylaminoimidazole-succinocarboxamide synthase